MNKLKGIFSKNKSGSKSSLGEATFQGLGYDIREKDLPKIHKAAWTGDQAKVKQLARKDACALDKENRTPLHLACAQGHLGIVQDLLEWSARTNMADNQLRTPLMKAVECNQEDVVNLLLEYKSDLDVKDGDKNTALHIAVKEGHTNIVAMLIKAGANINVKNRDGMTPLILSVRDSGRRDEHTRLLLESGASADEVDNSLRSALHHACMEDAISQVKLLLEKGADTNLKDSKGWTAEDCAMMKAYHACSQVIFDHNLKQRKMIPGGSVPSTPRNPSSASQSRHTTPRGEQSLSEAGAFGFGLPQAHQEDADDSDDQTVSKHSMHENRQDSWADDTDVSSAIDDHKLKGGHVKTSLTKHINIHSDEDEDVNQTHKGGASKQLANGKNGDITRPMYSRTPTPDAENRQSPATPGAKFQKTQSRIPVKKQTTIDGDISDLEEDESPRSKNNKVSFNETNDIKNIENSNLGYTPSGSGNNGMKVGSKMSQDQYKDDSAPAMMQSLGMEEMSDSSDADMDDSNPALEPTTNLTPRGILKKKSEPGFMPSTQPLVDTDDEESEWDSTRQSISEKHPSRSVEIRSDVESPEVDSDLENTLNPEKSQVEKTSQWDSTEEGYSPRAHRKPSNDLFNKEEDELEDLDNFDGVGLDTVEEAVTSFGARQEVEHSPVPQSDSSHPRSHDTGEPPTSSNSTSVQKTVIQREPVVTTPQQETADPADGEADSEWDSEASVNSEDEVDEGPPVVGAALSSPVVVQIDTPSPQVMFDSQNNTPSPQVVFDSMDNTPRTPRGMTGSTVTDEESVSDWELDRMKFKQQEQEQAELEKAEEERMLLEQMEEEEKRHREWEEEEARRIRELELEAQRELEREKSEGADMSVGSEFSDDEDNILPDANIHPGIHSALLQEQHLGSPLDSMTGSHLESDRSHNSNLVLDQRSDVSQTSDFSDPPLSPTSPTARELRKPPPKLQVSKLLGPPVSPKPKRDQTSLQMGQPENESPAPFHEDIVRPEEKEPIYQNQKSVQDAIHKLNAASSQHSAPGVSYGSPQRIPSGQGQHMTLGNAEGQMQGHVQGYQGNEADDMFDESDYEVEDIQDEISNDLEDIASSVLPDSAMEAKEDLIMPHMSANVKAAQPGTNSHSNFTEPATPTKISSSSVQQAESRASGKLNHSPPPLPSTAPPAKVMSLHDHAHSLHNTDPFDDLIIEPPQSKPSSTSLRDLPGLSDGTGLYIAGLDVSYDDDGLSVTSTENGDISASYRPESLPYGKDMLVNMNLNDSNAVLKLQEHLREHRKQLEYERSQKSLLDNKVKQMSKERADWQKNIDSLKMQKSTLEQGKLDLEAKIRNLEYCVNDEEEKKKNAELLLKKTKEQLSKKEEQYMQEMEAKQRAELAMRNVQMELRSSHNQIKDLEDEKVELERLLTNEKNARQLQEKINEEQNKLQQHIHEESVKSSSQRAICSRTVLTSLEDAKSALEIADDDIKHARDLVEKYKNETIALKNELQRQRQRLTEENSQLAVENEKLQLRVDDLRNELKDHEEALTQLTVQQNLHQSKLVSESTMLANSLDKERIAREKTEAELESYRTRLQSTTIQLEKSQHARNDFERSLHSDREEWARQLDRKDQEVKSLQERLQSQMHELNSSESKLNAVENELQISSTTYLERNNLLQQTQRDLQFYKTAHENYDSNFRHEKEQNAKLHGKIESFQDRLTALQHENLSLKQQADTAQHLASDRAGFDLQDKLNNMMISVKSDHEKTRANLEEKNNSLQDTITRLREEVRNSENKRSNLENEIRRLNQDHNDIIRKLSLAEASLDVATKARDHLEQERVGMKLEMEKLQQRYHSAQEKTIESQSQLTQLASRLDQTEQSRILSNQQLADTSASMHAFNNSKAELEESYQKLQVDHVRVDAELKHEKQKTEMLNRDLADCQKVRNSLEQLCSNLKSTNAHLEEKLGGEQATNKIISKDVEDHKGLWEQEVISRSKLGLRIAQLDRQRTEQETQLEEEKRRTRKALEQKKAVELKLDAEHDKSISLHKQLADMKNFVRAAKKQLKDREGAADEATKGHHKRTSSSDHLHVAFDHEKRAMEEMLISVKNQLDMMKSQLEDEVHQKDRISEKNVRLEKELVTIKKLEKALPKLEHRKRKLEEEFNHFKSSVETGYTDKATVEEAKREIEARSRLELNRKLDEVNNYLEEQARTRHKLDQNRDEQETKLRNDRKKFEEECTDLRSKYEQAVAKLETKDMEAKRYRDLYESEMQWRMRLSEQLYRSTDKAFNFKNNAERQRNRMYGSLANLSMNGSALDLGKLNIGDDALSNRLRAELDRSIAKHLEAAPHDNMQPLLTREDPVLSSSNFAKASADYIEVLKRKYCV